MGTLRSWMRGRPRLASWTVLSLGFAVMTLLAARGNGLTALQLLGLVLSCMVLAGACVWIIGWDSGEPQE